MDTLYSTQRPFHPSLKAKLELFENIQKGNLQKVRDLAYALSKVGRTNPQLYAKLSLFVEKNKKELIQIQSSDDENEPQIQNIDDQFVQDEDWDSDQSIDYETEGEDFEKEEKQNEQKENLQRKELFKDLKNNLCERRSISNKKINHSSNKTYQFKSPAIVLTKKPTQLKASPSKPQLHRNSAIGKAKNFANY